MDALNLPPYKYSVRNNGGRMTIFDNLRGKHVSLTPEEWVRQHFTHFLIDHKGYPPTLLQNEVELRCGNKKLRCDGVLFKNDGTARMILEYKAPSVAITQEVFNQITAYNILLKVEYLVISNGMQHYCCRLNYEDGTHEFLHDIPSYQDITGSKE